MGHARSRGGLGLSSALRPTGGLQKFAGGALVLSLVAAWSSPNAAEAQPTPGECESILPIGVVLPAGETGFVPGCDRSYVLVEGHIGDDQGGSKILSLPTCDHGPCAGLPPMGANTLRCMLAQGYTCCPGVGEVVQAAPGRNNPAVTQGLQDRWDSDTDRRANLCAGDYVGNGRRVVTVLVVQVLDGGRWEARVVGWATFFLKQRPSGGTLPVPAEFVRNVVRL
jgi:hypothetical protein